jgi:hypothetical protein
MGGCLRWPGKGSLETVMSGNTDPTRCILGFTDWKLRRTTRKEESKRRRSEESRGFY